MPSRKRSGKSSRARRCAAATSPGSCCQMLRIPVAIVIFGAASSQGRASSIDGELPIHTVP